MNTYRSFSLCVAFLLLIPAHSFPQGSPAFDVDAYRQFLESHRDMSAEQLRSTYPAGSFAKEAKTNPPTALYFDSIDAHYALTTHEKSLLEKHSFVVTERLHADSFGDAFLEIYKHDLPVFLSADAILHALHISYDEILKGVEYRYLIKNLDSLLTRLHDQVPTLAQRYATQPSMRLMLNDLDVYLTVPRILLGTATGPKLMGNGPTVQTLLDLVRSEQPAMFPLFSGTPRTIDFSQFTPRGHYTESPELTRYFQAMIWLGRTEIYLIAPVSADNPQKDEDIQRQTIVAVLIREAANSAQALPLLEEIDNIIKLFVGESDNVTLPNIGTLIQKTGTAGAHELLDVQRWKGFQQTLRDESYAFQRINSQILISDPMSPEQIEPASAFLLLGQRFVIDSYVTGNVVYDRILFNGRKIPRLLPSTLDVLFALGNSASGQLLVPELDRYLYSSNLSALRYLVDSYDPSFWASSLYNGWLNAIRSLNPPSQRTALPGFMHTAAWWQEKMNTQLSAWAQLRHDNLLYAKQSYTGGFVCSFPESYVEPVPAFYDAIKLFADSAATRFQRGMLQNEWTAHYFLTMRGIADTLGSIARKELAKSPLQAAEADFMKRMLTIDQVCGSTIDGWYEQLYYTGEEGLTLRDLVVADVHTAPTDESGAPVGWVLHAGTGPLNLAVVITELSSGVPCAFIGPVMSYYEHVSTNFKRLTDEEWKTMYAIVPSFRPSFVNLYLADMTGSSRGEGPSLITGIGGDSPSPVIPWVATLGQNYPNPFNSSTIITFVIPDALTNAHTELAVYNVQGQLVKQLISGILPSGNYAVRWDGTREIGSDVASGVYFYKLTIHDQRLTGKMSLVK